MTPAATAAAERAARRSAVNRPLEAPVDQPVLEVVDRRTRRRRDRRRRLLPVASALLVTGSLLAVVVGHSILDEDQVRLATIQSEITRTETQQRSLTVAVGQLEDPTKIAAAAMATLHMSAGTAIEQLPYVSLETPLPAPDVTPAPAPPAAATTAGSATTTTAGTSTDGAGGNGSTAPASGSTGQ